MKQEFKMTQQEMDDIISINKNQMPVLKIGNVTTGMDTQEKVNKYWLGLSEKYGFKQMSVEASSKGKLFFLAIPTPIKVEKTQADIEMEKYNTLAKIVDQLIKCDYECTGGTLVKNVAFMSLKRMAYPKG